MGNAQHPAPAAYYPSTSSTLHAGTWRATSPFRGNLFAIVTLLAAVALGSNAAAAPLGSTKGTGPGFPNVPQSAGAILSGLNAPQQGRTAIIAYHNGYLFTVPELPSSQPDSDFQVRTWDLTDPTSPVELATHGISPMPINAHGYLKSGDYLILGSNWPPESPWTWRADGPGVITRTSFPGSHGAGVRGNLFQPWFVGPTYWSYGDVEGEAVVMRDWVELASWDHLGLTGVIGHPFLLGDLLIFASDQSRTGVATYSLADPSNPVLLDVLNTGGPGGYWPELWGGDGKLYIVFPYRVGGNGLRVVDATDPTDLRFVTDRALSGDASMYIQFQDEYAFMGSHKVDMRTFESVLDLDGSNTVRPNDGGVGIDTSQFLLPLGNLLVTGGVGPNQGMAVWAHQSAPDTRGPSVGYHVPQAGRSNYPVGAPISLLIHETLETPTIVNGSTFIVRPVGGSAISGSLVFSFNDVLTFTPDQPLQADTTYEVMLPAGGIRDAVGNGIEGYAFTFSTGNTVSGNRPPSVDSLSASAYPAAPGQSVSLNATASDPDSDPVQLRFDFGDGSPRTFWSSSGSASHTYGEAGHYRATVQARDPSGVISTRALTVTVTTAPSGPRPTHSAPLRCDGAERRVWVVNPDNDTVAAVDADSLLLQWEQPVCDDPRSVVRTTEGELWVSCHGDDRLRVLNAQNGLPVGEVDLPYGSAPWGVAVSPDGNRVYVALEGRGELRRYAAATRQETGNVALGPRPRAVAVSADGGEVLVTRHISAKDHGEVWEVQDSTFTVSRTLGLAKLGGEENRDTTASGKGVVSYLAAIAISPDGNSAWVPGNKPNSERGTFFADDLDSDNTVRNVVAQMDLSGGEMSRAIDLDNSDSASAAAFSPLGDYLFVALQGNNEVVILDALQLESASGLGSLVTRSAVGAAPQGVCVDATTGRTFVKNFMGRSLSVLETDGLFRRGDKTFASSEVSTVASESLSAEVLLGKQIFYHGSDPRMSAEGYLSCASCHIDGGHDGRTWDFNGRGEGFRNTATLRGRGGMGQGNVHWTANFDEIQDFENDVRGAFGGTGFMDDADFASTSAPLGPVKAGLSVDLDAMAAYVASLTHSSLPRSPYRESNGALTAEAQAGRLVFDTLGCGSCHAGSELSDSTVGTTATLHNVGTLRTSSGSRLGGPLTGIDTPTLRGVWNTAPYFHDGSAQTLEDVFTVAGGEVMQAESGSISGGAQLVDQWVDLNNDDTVHGRAYVFLGQNGARLTFNGVDGGPGGTGAVELRYSRGYGPQNAELRVNGVPRSLVLPQTRNDPGWRHTVWESFRIEGVPLNAGTANTVEIATTDQFSGLSVDDVLVSTATELSNAQPHRAALALSSADRDALLAYLLQLDGSVTGAPTEAFFRDDFESGGTDSWALAAP